jgi:hypothetical protein
MERRVVLLTDDEDKAFMELLSRRSQAALESHHDARYRGWDICEVADMDNPPETDKKFCVFQIEENK